MTIATAAGTGALRNVALDDKYTLPEGRVYLNGIQALVRLALEQRRRDVAAGLNTAGFISGYRGSPLGTFDQQLWKAEKHLKADHVHFQPGLNEELAAVAVQGSQQMNLFPGARYDGVFSMWYGKAPGVDRAGDALRHGASVGSSKHGGVLVLAGDDHNCKSSTLATQSEFAAVHAMMPVLNPAGLEDVITFGLLGWAMSRYSGAWVMLKCLIDTMDASGSIAVSDVEPKIVVPDAFAKRNLSARWPDPPLEQERRMHEQRLPAALAFARANGIDRIVVDGGARPRIGIMATGKSLLDTRQALHALGITEEKALAHGIALYKVGMSWPLETDSARRFADGLEHLIVVEEKRSLIEQQLARALYDLPDGRRPQLIGKMDAQGRPFFPAPGEISSAEIARALAPFIEKMAAGDDAVAKRIAQLTERRTEPAIASSSLKRLPYFCPGCPHNASTKVPEGSRALAGIGCHYMAHWMDRSTETFSPMGSEGASWIGQAPFTDTKHVFVNIGDGTYTHSGSLAIRAAVAADVTITYKLLYNDAVAMTGGQTAEGALTVPQIVAQLKAEGVKTIRVLAEDVTVYPRNALPADVPLLPREDLEATQRALRDVPGVSVLIYDQTCAAEKRRRRKQRVMPAPAKRVFINEEVCEGCGDCGAQSNCLAIVPAETELGRKRQVDQSACNVDLSCAKGFCPSFVTIEGGTPRKADPKTLVMRELPEPAIPTLTEPYNIVIGGIGGSGVVTIGALLGMAAHLEGKGASVLDMIGMSQKGGQVLAQVRIAASPSAIEASRIPHARAQLLIGCDLIVAANADCLALVDPQHGRAIVNEHATMPAEFTHDADLAFPKAQLTEALTARVGSERTRFVDATAHATQSLGDAIMTNPFLLGFAWQMGLIPLRRESLRAAIELNGVAVADNTRAFEFGRTIAASPNAPRASETTPTLDQIVAVRARHLTAYQNTALAERYRALVARVAAEETKRAPGKSGLAEAAAITYARLLAIKDEYEVARLFVDGRFKKAVTDAFDGRLRITYHLAPPLFARRDPATGHLLKSSYGPWMEQAFKLLAGFKFLRGTSFDPFGYTAERRTERRLIADYEALIEKLLSQLSTETHAASVRLASLPSEIRGYGHVKAATIARVKAERQRV